MTLTDMKLLKRNKEELKKEMPSVEIERDRWPYGLQLRFESEQVNKLPYLKNMKIGEKVSVSGIGEVTSIRMNEKKGGKEDYTVEVQIQKIGCEGMDKKSESMGEAMKRYQKSNSME